MLATAINKIKGLSTEQLLEIRKEIKGHNPEIRQVRGWILDELESRNQEAFDAWLDSDEHHPDKFFLG